MSKIDGETAREKERERAKVCERGKAKEIEKEHRRVGW